MLWWIGAALALLVSVAWALSLSVVVSRGEKWLTSVTVGPWYLFHAATGVLAFWMILRVAR